MYDLLTGGHDINSEDAQERRLAEASIAGKANLLALCVSMGIFPSAGQAKAKAKPAEARVSTELPVMKAKGETKALEARLNKLIGKAEKFNKVAGEKAVAAETPKLREKKISDRDVCAFRAK